MEALLDSGVTGLVMSSELTRKNKFRKKKLDRPIYIRNIDSTFNHKGPIEHIVEVGLFHKGYKERTKIDVIGGQCYNSRLKVLSQERNLVLELI